MAQTKVQKAEAAVEAAKADYDKKLEDLGADAEETVAAKSVLDAAEETLKAEKEKAAKAPTKTKSKPGVSDGVKAKEQYTKLLGNGIDSLDQAQKVFAAGGYKPPAGIRVAYMTSDGNVFWKNDQAARHANRLGGGFGKDPRGKIYHINL